MPGKPQQVEDVFEDPTPEEVSGTSSEEQAALAEALASAGEGEAASAPTSEDAAAAEGEEAAPAVEEAEASVEDHGDVERVEPEEEAIDPPSQREDGKWQMGKYVADSVEELLLEVERGRRHAERIGHQRAREQEDGEQEYRNPFDVIAEEQEDDGGDDAAWFGEVIGQAAQQLAQQQAAPAVNDGISPMAQQALANAQRVVQDPMADDQAFRAVLNDVVQHAPQVAFGPNGVAERVLQEWANTNPYAALSARQDLQVAAVAAHQQAQLEATLQQQQYEAQQQYETQNAAVQEWTEVRSAFEQTHADWTDRAEGMNAFLQANPYILPAARAIEDPQQRKAAVYQALHTAYEVSQPSAPQPHGTATGDAGTMPDEQPDPVAAHKAALATDRELGGVDTTVGSSMGTIPTGVDPDDPAASDYEELMGVRNLG